uniref:Phosphoheptose isomerase n=1 Tax=Lygus hesperus TaxID=30085 RepID=A0A0A9WE36_LYGHE
MTLNKMKLDSFKGFSTESTNENVGRNKNHSRQEGRNTVFVPFLHPLKSSKFCELRVQRLQNSHFVIAHIEITKLDVDLIVDNVAINFSSIISREELLSTFFVRRNNVIKNSSLPMLTTLLFFIVDNIFVNNVASGFGGKLQKNVNNNVFNNVTVRCVTVRWESTLRSS